MNAEDFLLRLNADIGHAPSPAGGALALLESKIGAPPMRIVYEGDSKEGSRSRWARPSTRYPGDGNRQERRAAAKGRKRLDMIETDDAIIVRRNSPGGPVADFPPVLRTRL